jgi:receptor-binding and translocation channel-forming TcA subunit of Tc toxin/ABC toxin-like protein/neuraminidase-like protein
MPNRTFKIAGRVIDRKTRSGVAGLRVESWDKALVLKDQIGSAVTNADGAFQIEFEIDDKRLKELTRDGKPEVFFKVFADGRLLRSTEDSVLWNFEKAPDVIIEGDFAAATQTPIPIVIRQVEPVPEVHGTIRMADGLPANGFAVAAFDRDLRSEWELGRTQTDPQGFYRVHYKPEQVELFEAGSADLVVKVFSKDGVVLATSPILFNAPLIAEVDLTVSEEALPPTPLFDRIQGVLKPLLGQLAIEQLDENNDNQDITFLAGETSFEKRVLARFALAHRIKTRELPPEFWFVLLRNDALFEFDPEQDLEKQLRAVVENLSTLDATTVRNILADGLRENDIAKAFGDKTDRWVEAFVRFVASRTLSDKGDPTFVKAALDHAGIKDTKKQEKFAQLFLEHKALTPELLTILDKDKSFSKPEVDDLRTSFQLAQLTGSDFTVVKALKDEFKVREPQQIRQLAKRSEEQWVEFAKKKQGEIKLPFEVGAVAGREKVPEAEVFGKMLDREFRNAFPTAAFAGGLQRATSNGGSKGLKQARQIGQFLERNESFELMRTPIDDFLKADPNAGRDPLAKDDGFRQELKAVQRVFKLAPSFEATDALLAENLHSAQQIYRLGRNQFVQRFADKPGFTRESAKLTWNRAADTHAAVVTIVGDIQSLDAEGLPQALKTAEDGVSTFPNWDNLFKAGDLCECEHCRSVLSPAAYFADLLMFVRDRRAENPAFTVKDILFRRRADLGFIELNCDNALTPFPYVDTVCEVLESVVDTTGANDLQLAGFTAIPADPVAAKAAVATAFTNAFANPVNNGKQKIALGLDFTLSQVTTADPDRWVVHGDDASYLLKKKGGSDFFAQILRNTKTTADELRAYPQYVNPKAYETLRTQRFPMGLPFDLFAEEVRAACQKTNLQRWDLMQTYRGPAAPNNPTTGQIAAEYFGISIDPAATTDEFRLILVADTTVATQQAVWGESAPSWLTDVGNVKNFLNKTGLEYNDVLTLLDLKFINPSGNLIVNHLDSSCDLDKKVIQVLSPTILDRLHRFLRLWRKLKGWTMWELDLVIRHPQIGNGVITEPFLINLFYFQQLRKRLGSKVTVEQAAALFGDLNIETHFTELYKKRDDAIYQKTFLNRRLFNPLDAAFEIPAGATDLVAGQTMTDHQPVIMAALGLREADLAIFKGLAKVNGTPYLSNDNLNLANLSFLWRHSWLAKLLKYKAADWQTLLKVFNQDVTSFTNPEAAWNFVQNIDRMTANGFTPDELIWILDADLNAKAAVKEADATRFLAALRKELQSIRDQFDPAQFEFLTAVPPTDASSLTTLLTSLLQQLNRDETATQFFVDTLENDIAQEREIPTWPGGFVLPAPITSTIPISFSDGVLRFKGVMLSTQQNTLLNDVSLAAVTGNVDYQNAINDFFNQPRLALKFFEPLFTAPLDILPAAVDFRSLTDPALASKISYDAEERLLQFSGILSQPEKALLDALSADVAYRGAVNSLFTQPGLAAPPDERIWLMDADLLFPLRDENVPANDNLAKNLATAINKALAYLSRTRSRSAVLEQSSAALGLTEAVTDFLLTKYARLPATVMDHLTGPFVATSSVIDYATLKQTFDAWYWMNRAASLLKKWKVTLEELERIVALTTNAQLLDLLSLPIDNAGAIASIDRLLRTASLMRLRDTLPETELTLLEVLERLSDAGATQATFAADVELLNEDWLATDVTELIASLNLTFKSDYFLAENWERLRRAFYFIDNLNANAATVKTFAAATMNFEHASTMKELLRSKFGEDTWLTLSAEIQDVLRERKRDALVAYLLTHPQPDPPSQKWENTNDLYAYYLLDVEMSSCQLTSRLVQGSGSIQLFVQRCFMGLEPDVTVIADGDDGDSAWKWWKWMSKYRVWEANRKVFLWPENWIEPELKVDRSQFFKDLENELTQNEINEFTVETAFTNYLDKLDGVAQLEIAGFYHEDDGDNAIVHVFGRTPGAEPHLYYYRTYDYRQWTPWEKVELDIQGDYLVPAVVGKRLFLFWPIFTEVPDDTANKTAPVPKMDTQNSQNMNMQKAKKRLKLQMACSDYRLGKWTPKRVSKDFVMSSSYEDEIVRKNYQFYLVDRSEIDGRFGINFEGSSLAPNGVVKTVATFNGGFEITGCKGLPVLGHLPGIFKHTVRPETGAVNDLTEFLKWVELESFARTDVAPKTDFTLQNLAVGNGSLLTPLLVQTPGIFKDTPPWHMSYMDKLLADGMEALPQFGDVRKLTIGSWLPFFYNDKKRTFFVLPCIAPPRKRGDNLTLSGGVAAGNIRMYYPEVKKVIRQLELFFEGFFRTWVDSQDFTALTQAQRHGLDQFLFQQFPLEAPPPDPNGTPGPYSEARIEQIKDLIVRFFMRFAHLYIGLLAQFVFLFRQFHFKNFYHPFVCEFAKLAYNPLKGIPAMMSRDTQLKNTGFNFKLTHQPTIWVVEDGTEEFYPMEDVDFRPDGAYAPYNWELFYHAPLLIGNMLSKNQRFEEARDWYHYIFNPIGVEGSVPGGSPMSKYWITKPFFETTDPEYVQQRIENIMRMLAGDTGVPGFSAAAKSELEAQVLDWRTYPFEPHRIANYRTVAYQKTVVMKYLDNLIAWGDFLFRQDSMESINEATQLYILAAEILGPRPRKVPPQIKPPVESFNELETELDKFSNALIQVENLVPPPMGDEDGDAEDAPPIPMLYFCIPRNDKMLSYWDTVADRLFKIRHCMNIEGVVRQLALFEPPIDPAALVKAVAGGVDISSALADLNAPLPLYRFSTLMQQANQVCDDVKALGGALLGALEKKDAEALNLLRQGQEIRMHEAVKAVKKQQIDEAKENLASSQLSKELAQLKLKYYESREFMNTGETVALTLGAISIALTVAGSVMDILGGVLAAVPDFDVGASGFGGSPVVKIKTGGVSFSKAVELAARAIYQTSTVLDKSASIATTVASYQRRKEEWDFQRDLAAKEIQQLERSIAAAELRIAIAEKELANQEQQIEDSKAVDAFMRSKYTNLELYQWQIGQISGVYFQSYRLAYDLAKRAERCFRFELGLADSSYINFGYWDSLKKGLMSGEKLQYDLRRLDSAYVEKNRREFELTKHISLALHDPLALIRLRETGRCFFQLPEEIFDLDYPGHYFRRIKSVSMTLPCVVGPYTTAACTLRLLKNSIRVVTTNGDNGYERNTDDVGLPADDERFIENNIGVKAIAASTAQNDSGVFELNFHDERYLPFEGAGVISNWSVELFNDPKANNPDPDNPDFGKALRQFDYSTISDVVLHVKYTAREDAGLFKNNAVTHLRDYFEEEDQIRSIRMFDLRQEFPAQWHRFLHPANAADGNVFEFEMSSDLFPLKDAGKTLKINTIWLVARAANSGTYTITMTPPLPEPPPDEVNVLNLAPSDAYGRMHIAINEDVAGLGVTVEPDDPPAAWRLRMRRPGGDDLGTIASGEMEVSDLVMVLGYEWE